MVIYSVSRYFSSALFGVILATSSLATAEQEKKNWNTEKLKPKGTNELSLQAITEIYIGCLEAAVEHEVEERSDIKQENDTEGADQVKTAEAITEDKEKAIKVSYGDLQKHCHETRKLYESRTSKAAADKFDEVYMEQLEKRELRKAKS